MGYKRPQHFRSRRSESPPGAANDPMAVYQRTEPRGDLRSIRQHVSSRRSLKPLTSRSAFETRMSCFPKAPQNDTHMKGM
jgi:hypothetical protein